MPGKPKPTSLKLVTGNPGKRPLPKNEPMPKTPVGDPPQELNDDGLAEWHRVSKELSALGMITGFDRQSLLMYCVAYQLWVDALRKVNASGAMLRSPKGFPLQNPYLAVVNKQAEIMIKLASDFGFSPAARARIGIALEDKSRSDPAEAFFAESG